MTEVLAQLMEALFYSSAGFLLGWIASQYLRDLRDA